jgi:hypothetical protein
MQKYEQAFETLPPIRATIPYFLELPTVCEQLPDGLDGKDPYLVCVGRMEPRKGSDLAMRAFTQIADEYPNLKLVFLGKEMWHHGEKIADVIALNVAERHRSRIVKLGNVPRDQALAAVKQASVPLREHGGHGHRRGLRRLRPGRPVGDGRGRQERSGLPRRRRGSTRSLHPQGAR